MPAPTRDRLARRVDISSLYPGAARRVNLIVDEPGLLWSGLSTNPFPNLPSPQAGSGRRITGSPGSRSSSFLRVNRAVNRTPLRDITHVVRVAVVTQQETTASAAVPSIAHVNHKLGESTPVPVVKFKPQVSPAFHGYNENKADEDFMTPQKRLLDSIEKVREVWLEEQRKLEKTPSAKRAARQKKIRTLMSMR